MKISIDIGVLNRSKTKKLRYRIAIDRIFEIHIAILIGYRISLSARYTKCDTRDTWRIMKLDLEVIPVCCLIVKCIPRSQVCVVRRCTCCGRRQATIVTIFIISHPRSNFDKAACYRQKNVIGKSRVADVFRPFFFREKVSSHHTF